VVAGQDGRRRVLHDGPARGRRYGWRPPVGCGGAHVELLLDEAAELAVREAWRRLADAGLPSQARHRSPTNSPHLTLAACPELTAPIRWEFA
jgi:hypothetical protein